LASPGLPWPPVSFTRPSPQTPTDHRFPFDFHGSSWKHRMGNETDRAWTDRSLTHDPPFAKTTLSHSWSKDNVCNRKTESHNDYIPEPQGAPHGLSNRLAARERFWHPAGAQIHPWFFKKKRKLFPDFKKTSQSSFAWDVVARNQTPPKVRCRFLFSFPLVCFGIGLLTDFPFSYSFGDHGLVSIYSPAPIIFHNLSD